MGFQSVLIFVTETGMRKSILDATDPLRRFLLGNGIHDYGSQKQGESHKVVSQGLVLDEQGEHTIPISLYRPETKHGDPRLWPYRLSQFASGGDVLAALAIRGKLALTNLSRVRISAGQSSRSPLLQSLSTASADFSLLSAELLAMFRKIASRGPIRSSRHGDTAVGMAIESALGIVPNSSRSPDFKGIEIKATRARKKPSQRTRSTLFACVPNWELSRLKSSAAILKEFGYRRDGALKLYCQVSTKGPNSQGLVLDVDAAARLLRETHVGEGATDVVVWELERLENRLADKHRETFWVHARSERRGAVEWFHLESIVHTKSPNLPQLQRLLETGDVSVDHLIKRMPGGGAKEKGPLFKIHPEKLSELFLGDPVEYRLDGG